MINRALDSKRATLKNHTSKASALEDAINSAELDRVRLSDQLFTFLGNDGAERLFDTVSAGRRPLEEYDDSDR